MNDDVIHMITEISESEAQTIEITLHAGGDARRNLYTQETYPCLADYWQERLVKKDEA